MPEIEEGHAAIKFMMENDILLKYPLANKMYGRISEVAGASVADLWLVGVIDTTSDIDRFFRKDRISIMGSFVWSEHQVGVDWAEVHRQVGGVAL